MEMKRRGFLAALAGFAGLGGLLGRRPRPAAWPDFPDRSILIHGGLIGRGYTWYGNPDVPESQTRAPWDARPYSGPGAAPAP